METLAKCMAKACGADVDQKLPHRQMTASLSVGFGLLDLLTDLAVSVFFFATANYYWGSLILLTILLTNLWSMYKYSKEIYPWKTTAVMSFFGLLNVRILTRFWAQLDQEAHYRKLMDARLVEVLLESIPSAIVQLYAIVLINTPTVDEFLLIGSCLVSMLNFTYGLRNWYKFTVVNGDTADFEAETKFVFWYVWLEVFCFCDFIVRAGSLALFLSIDNLRPWSLLAAPLGMIFFCYFVFFFVVLFLYFFLWTFCPFCLFMLFFTFSIPFFCFFSFFFVFCFLFVCFGT